MFHARESAVPGLDAAQWCGSSGGGGGGVAQDRVKQAHCAVRTSTANIGGWCVAASHRPQRQWQRASERPADKTSPLHVCTNHCCVHLYRCGAMWRLARCVRCAYLSGACSGTSTLDRNRTRGQHTRWHVPCNKHKQCELRGTKTLQAATWASCL